jgi:actin-related protein
MDDTVVNLVLANGSSVCKAGFAGNETPTSVIPAVIGHRTDSPGPGWIRVFGPDRAEISIGHEACGQKGITLRRTNPIRRGIIVDFDNQVKIWEYQFRHELHCDPSEHPLLLSEPTLNSQADRERTTETMFETFRVPAFYLANQGVLSLLSYGLTTGLVVDIGDGLCQIVPVYEGHHVQTTASILNLGGSDVTSFLKDMICQRGYNFSKFAEREIFSAMKEKHAYVSLNYDADMRKAANTTDLNVSYILPDGTEITLGEECFRCPEILFGRRLFHGIENDGVPEKVLETINACDVALRKDMYANIVLSGGSTLIRGFVERFENEIVRLAPETAGIKISASEAREHAAWKGGSILASCPVFSQMAITREEYNEIGSWCHLVERKFF